MPTPRAGYYLKDGTRVPGTTTIIGRFKDSGALMQWAFRQGKEGKSSLYEESAKAADIGTTAHAMVEAHIKGASAFDRIAICEKMLPDHADQLKAYSAFGAYELWAANFKVRPVAQEVQLVSEEHQFGGTPDLIGTVGNALAMIDFKTSSGVYSDYLVQVAAYGALWDENHPEQPITGGYHILRFSKQNADFAHHHFPNLDEAWRLFLHFRAAYDIDKVLKKRAA